MKLFRLINEVELTYINYGMNCPIEIFEKAGKEKIGKGKLRLLEDKYIIEEKIEEILSSYQIYERSEMKALYHIMELEIPDECVKMYKKLVADFTDGHIIASIEYHIPKEVFKLEHIYSIDGGSKTLIKSLPKRH